MPVKGVTKVRSNMKQIFKDIEQKKAKQFVAAVLSIGWNESKEFTPVEYSNLINSVTMNIDMGSGSVMGTLTYNADYAAALEFGTWQPVPVSMKAGPASNMQATPHFLKKGFESSQSQTAIKRVEKIFKV